MQVTVTGKQVDVGDALRSHVETSLAAVLEKYFGTAIEAHAGFAKEAHRMRAEVSIHIGRGIVVNGGGIADDFYAAFDAASERIAKQLRRYKRRLRDHHASGRPPGDASMAEEPATRSGTPSAPAARSYILAPLDEEDEAGAGRAESAPAGDAPAGDAPAGDAPVVIAEMSTELPHLTVGEAVMRMDLADAPVMLFRNRAHGALNLVYRRCDGNVGWIDPGLDAHGLDAHGLDAHGLSAHRPDGRDPGRSGR